MAKKNVDIYKGEMSSRYSFVNYLIQNPDMFVDEIRTGNNVEVMFINNNGDIVSKIVRYRARQHKLLIRAGVLSPAAAGYYLSGNKLIEINTPRGSDYMLRSLINQYRLGQIDTFTFNTQYLGAAESATILIEKMMGQRALLVIDSHNIHYALNNRTISKQAKAILEFMDIQDIEGWTFSDDECLNALS